MLGVLVRFCMDMLNNCSDSKSYDVFLTHSIRDTELVLGLKILLNFYKYTVYVDWSSLTI
jgi:hypothetical protein